MRSGFSETIEQPMRSDVLMENYLSILDGMGISFMTGSKGLKDQQKALPARL